LSKRSRSVSLNVRKSRSLGIRSSVVWSIEGGLLY
jgi:hypothetical protein